MLRPTVFWPRPQVDSAILQILPLPAGREQIGDRNFFHDFVRRLFQQRRKSLRSVLAGMYRQELSKTEIDEVLEPFQFIDGVRADALEIDALVKLSAVMQARLAAV
jgi:16S rRNA (adenine1518-N6/adenine1519-N6)-dimethyltransferase